MNDVLADSASLVEAEGLEGAPGPDDHGGPPAPPETRPETTWRWYLVAAGIQIVVFAPTVYNALFRSSVYPSLWLWHAARIRETFRTPLEPIQPHFGWAAISRAVDLVIPAGDPRVAGMITGLAAVGLTGAVLFHILRTDDRGGALLSRRTALAGALFIALLESPAAIQGWVKMTDPDTSFVPLFYGFVPTTVAVTGLNLLLVWMAARVIDGTLGARSRRWLPVLVIVTSAIKPTLVLPLAVASLTVAWAIHRRDRARRTGEPSPLVPVARLIVFPALAISVVQYLIVTYLVTDALQGGVKIAPFEELRALGGFGWQFWLVTAVPLALMVLVRAPLFEDRAVTLSFLCALVGIGAAVVLARSGRTFDVGSIGGDVLQLAAAGIAVSLVFGLRRAIVLWREDRLARWIAAVLVVLLVPYVAAGLNLWRCEAGLTHCYSADVAPQWPQKPIEDL